METEVLNEYLFAELLTDWARSARDRRIRGAVSAGKLDEGDVHAKLIAPISHQDLQEGFRMLEQRRGEALALLRESP